MIDNAIAQSSLPIISYNYGLSEWSRIARARRLSLGLAAVCGLVTTIVGVLYSPLIAGVFLLGGQPAWQIAVNGFPWYSISFVFFSVNVVFIGYYQSIERFIGNVGLWLAVPFTELITLLVMVTYFWASGKK